MARSTTFPSPEEARFGDVTEPITLRVVLAALAGGTLGLAAMLPFVVGIPVAFGVFQLAPLADIGTLIAGDGGPLVGAAIFAAGGAFVLPLFFVVTGSFLPPRNPRYMRGVTMSTLFWVTFLLLFWPGGSAFTNAVFVVATLLGHWMYGLVLGVTTHYLTGIPEHDV